MKINKKIVGIIAIVIVVILVVLGLTMCGDNSGKETGKDKDQNKDNVGGLTVIEDEDDDDTPSDSIDFSDFYSFLELCRFSDSVITRFHKIIFDVI